MADRDTIAQDDLPEQQHEMGLNLEFDGLPPEEEKVAGPTLLKSSDRVERFDKYDKFELNRDIVEEDKIEY